MGFRSNIFHLSPHADGLTPGSARVHMPFTSSCTMAFPSIVQGRRVSGLSRPGFSPTQDSPSNTRPALVHEAAPFALYYGLRFWQAPLTGFDSLWTSCR
jgi:hypothetical protein